MRHACAACESLDAARNVQARDFEFWEQEKEKYSRKERASFNSCLALRVGPRPLLYTSWLQCPCGAMRHDNRKEHLLGT